MRPLTPWAAKRWTHFRSAEYVKCSVSETVWRRCPLTTSRTAWARRKTRASFVCFKKVSKVGRASLEKCSLRVRMRGVSTIKYYKNRCTMRLLYYRHKAFPTQIFWKLLIDRGLEVSRDALQQVGLYAQALQTVDDTLRPSTMATGDEREARFISLQQVWQSNTDPVYQH